MITLKEDTRFLLYWMARTLSQHTYCMTTRRPQNGIAYAQPKLLLITIINPITDLDNALLLSYRLKDLLTLVSIEDLSYFLAIPGS